MFDIETCYRYCRVGDHSSLTINRKYVEHLTIYSFRTNLYPYLIEVERYPYDIYVLKFYRRKHKGNKQRYNLLSNEGKCSRIVATCFSIFLDIYNQNPLASFGFLGANTVDEKTGKIESKNQTKRFRVYKRAVFNYFGEETFSHFESPDNSIYLAISNKNKFVNKISEGAAKILEHLIE
ncbi:MAG TPA: hypothetical protein VIJ27_12215 [Mucilaginibacter sp.]